MTSLLAFWIGGGSGVPGVAPPPPPPDTSLRNIYRVDQGAANGDLYRGSIQAAGGELYRGQGGRTWDQITGTWDNIPGNFDDTSQAGGGSPSLFRRSRAPKRTWDEITGTWDTLPGNFDDVG